MDKIEVGEYIRTKTHGIKRVIRINEKATKNRYIVYYGIDKEGDKTYITINIDDIINHSKNLIDVIEVGDFVNEKYVAEINQYKSGKSIIAFIGIIDEQDIETILTKEQYNQNCYKVNK